MCVCPGTCCCRRGSGGLGEFIATAAAAGALFLLRKLLQLVKLLLIALVALIVWASPRLWRASRRAAYSARSRWQARKGARVVAVLGPQLALTAAPHTDTRWSTMAKEAHR
ncbi:hypothetical protein ACFFWC_24615 [Plantactinospora siamensis]|uniref:Uncharacterized protein n=1 Tax=Plantactinospora siamensis TaxID=555372 RepID=A0ABV6P8P6_9ACTN